MLSATGRKYLRGPRGTGLLYVRHAALDRLEPPFLDLHAAEWVAPDRYEIRPDARRFENWESNVAGKVGLGVAIDYALGWGLEAIAARVGALAEALRTRLGIVSFTVEGLEPETVRRRLAGARINVSTSTPRGTRLDMEARRLAGVVRASVHYYNTEDEVERFCAALAACMRE
jgi:selenocysteine lyase/cysteine desulfurase